MTKLATVVLRGSLSACFLGHGVVAMTVHAPWLAFFAVVGIGDQAARVLMPLVGALDVAVAIALLAHPCRALFAWAATWTLVTAVVRSLAGGDLVDVIARAANWAPPLALLVLAGGPGWVRRVDGSGPSDRARAVATALLALATAAIAMGFVVRGVNARWWAIDHALDFAKLLERAGVVGVPVALVALTIATVRERRRAPGPA